MEFLCPSCQMQLKAEPEPAGQVVRCPSCNSRLQIPANMPDSTLTKPGAVNRTTARHGWKETDPTNPNMLVSLGLGLGLLAIWYLILLPFKPAPDRVNPAYTTMEFVKLPGPGAGEVDLRMFYKN